MNRVALSSGCFMGSEKKLMKAGVEFVELSSHPHKKLAEVLGVISHSAARISSVHAPCPNRGLGIDLGADKENWRPNADAVRETMEVAARVGAEYVVIHAFYNHREPFPVNDIERMSALRRNLEQRGNISIASYLESYEYEQARFRSVENLKSILPELKRRFPAQRIVIENLNPRIGYGGIRISDLVQIVSDLGGEVGICLDYGHFALACSALEEPGWVDIMRSAKDFIWTTHLHQNFGGAFYVDRFWDEERARDDLQDVDTHLPFTAKYSVIEGVLVSCALENRPFERIMKGPIQYAKNEHESCVEGIVQNYIESLPSSCDRVLELDSRYAPLEQILEEYRLLAQGDHPMVR
jgi:sugar phosphate isomerase/epimerase